MRSVMGVWLLAFALAGCVSTAQSSYGSKWIGRSLDSFVLANGPPASTYSLQDGRRMVEWQASHGVGRNTIAVLGGASIESGSAQLNCRVRMTVARSGTIEGFAVVNDTVGMWSVSRCAEVLAPKAV